MDGKDYESPIIWRIMLVLRLVSDARVQILLFSPEIVSTWSKGLVFACTVESEQRALTRWSRPYGVSPYRLQVS